MKFYYGLKHVNLSGSVVTIGAFDGVHLGHQALITQLLQQAKAFNLPSVVVLFEPQPKEYFSKATSRRIYRLRDKLAILSQLGVDHVVCLHFTDSMAKLSPETFINKVLLEGLGVKHLVVGDDFRFGAKRQGDYALLQRFGERNDYSIENTPTVMVDGRRVGSSWVREALLVADFSTVTRLLGRAYQLSGKIGQGQKLGRTIGIPTLNIRMPSNLCLSGIFAVEVLGIIGQNRAVRGAGYIGFRPTLKGHQCFLEVHLLGPVPDCYGQVVQVKFLAKIRDDSTFDSVAALKTQMQHDIKKINHFFETK